MLVDYRGFGIDVSCWNVVLVMMLCVTSLHEGVLCSVCCKAGHGLTVEPIFITSDEKSFNQH